MATQKITPAQIYNPYKFAAHRATTQAAGTVIFDSEYFDTNSNYSTSTGIYTCPITGYYQFNVCTTQSVSAAPQDPVAYIYKNASPVAYSHFVNMYNGASSASANCSALLYCVAGDAVKVIVDRSLAAYSAGNTFSGFLVSV